MTVTIDCIYDGEVFRPLEKIDLIKGERLTLHIERHISLNPIVLQTPVTDELIQSLRRESWTSL